MSASKMRLGELARGVLKILIEDREESLRAKHVLSLLEKEVPPTDFEKEHVKTGAQRYRTNARFVTTDLVRAGWLTKDNHQWSITEGGRKAYETFSDPTAIYQEARRYKQPKDNQPLGDDIPGNEADDSTSLATLEEAQENAWMEIENHLAKMLPYNLQEVVAGLLEGMGYHIHWVAPPGPDGGVDIHAGTDSLGISGKRIKVQVKRRAHTLPVNEVRSFQGVLEDGDMGIFISTGGFTRDAEREARRGQRRLVLIDAVRFFDLWEEHYEKIPEARRRLLPIKRVSFLDLSNIPNA